MRSQRIEFSESQESVWLVLLGFIVIRINELQCLQHQFKSRRDDPVPARTYTRRTSVPASRSCSPCLRSVNPTMM